MTNHWCHSRTNQGLGKMTTNTKLKEEIDDFEEEGDEPLPFQTAKKQTVSVFLTSISDGLNNISFKFHKKGAFFFT